MNSPRPSKSAADVRGRLTDLLATLSLEEKVQLLTGRDFWTTWPIEKIGLRRMLVSDGPSGVRGETWDERSPSLNLPSATALSSSWDPAVAARYGTVSAAEARRKSVDVVLGPTINLHRSPLAGRHFEAFSEDPLLTGELAAAYVRGVQENGVGATPKHYVANDSETERFTVDVRVSDRALRELYLLAFEKAVVESNAWLVMSAYNSVNGVTATENNLLDTPLNSEWGFDGVVISDWTAVRSIASALSAQDLVMPGPDGPWGPTLVEAVREGIVPEDAIDRKVLRLLLLASRVGALDGFGEEETVEAVDGVAFARYAAAEGSVLVRNEGELPWAVEQVSSIAVIGHNAKRARTQGGGSATVVPSHVVSPVDGVRGAFPGARVTYSVGAVVQEGIAEFAPGSMVNPATGRQGAQVRFLDQTGNEIYKEERYASALIYFGGDAPVGQATALEFRAQWTSDETGTTAIGFAGVGSGDIYWRGELVHTGTAEAVGDDLGAAFLAPPSISVPISVTAGESVEVRFVFRPQHNEGGLRNALNVTFGLSPAVSDADALIAEAAEAAASADVALVVVGTNSQVESEGFDRSSMALPGRQDDLVRAVVAANPRTVVVVNAGAPVELPWRDDVAAILVTYFGGQEFGNALADVLTGAIEPGGRLPTTWPKSENDLPVRNVTPVEGTLTYDEGIHVGYRAWLRGRATPAYNFGFGLGYTNWAYGKPRMARSSRNAPAELRVSVRNTGDRLGKQVVQVYASRRDSTVDRPVRWLVGFDVVRAEPGKTIEASIAVPERGLAYWADGWQYEAGTYELHVGTSVVDLFGRVDAQLSADGNLESD